jgi:MATE family multidrug resistance protein
MTVRHEAPSHALAWRLAGPIILANLSVPMLGAVDTAVMGHLPNPAYLGGVAVGAVVFQFIYWGFGFLRMGTTGLVAQADGAGDQAEVRAILLRSLLIAAGAGAVLWILQVPIFALAGALFDASAEVEGFAHDYFRIRIWSAPATLANYCLIGWFIGMRNTRAALILQLWMNGLNIVLSLTFVVGLGWGVEGVATATAIAEYAAVAMALYLWRNQSGIAVGLTIDLTAIFDAARLRRLFGVNFDIFIRTLCLIATFALFTRQGASMGDALLAANAILMQLQSFLSFGLDGFAHAAEAMVGGAVGARDKTAFRQSVRITGQWALIVAAGYTIVYAAAAPFIIAALTDIPDVRATAGDYFIWLAISPVVSVWSFMLDGIFIGATRTRDMRNAMIFSLVVFLIAMAILQPMFGNHGLWSALMIFMAARAISLGYLYHGLLRSLDRAR